jgi:hypothetical protein
MLDAPIQLWHLADSRGPTLGKYSELVVMV